MKYPTTKFLDEEGGSGGGMTPSPIGNPWEGSVGSSDPGSLANQPSPSPSPTPATPAAPAKAVTPSPSTPVAPSTTIPAAPTGDAGVVATPPASDWTPERVAELLRVSRETSQPMQAPPQMAQEDIDRMLNSYQAGPEEIQALLEGGENAVAAMNKIIQGAVTHARTVSWYQTQVLLRQQQQQMTPVMEYYHQAQQKELTNTFFNENKDFKPEVHMKLLAAVKTSLDAEDAFRGKTRAESFKLIADRAKDILTASGTPLVPVASPTPSNGAGGKMAQLSRGAGHGAAAAAGSGGAPQSTAQRLFGS
jgi:hypothetical protein